MRKRKKIIIISCIIGALFIACLGLFISRYKEEAKKWQNVNISEDIDELLYVEIDRDSGDMCVIKNININTPLEDQISIDGYVYICNFQYKQNFRNLDIKVKKSQVDVYDLETREKIKTYDLATMIDDYVPENKWNGYIYAYQEADRDLYFKLWTIGEQPEEDKDIYINFVTGEVTVLDSWAEFEAVDGAKETARSAYESDIYYLISKNEIGLEQANGLDFICTNCLEMGYWVVTLKKSALPEENSILYSKFSGLKDYQGGGDESVSFYIVGDPTPEEILSMLIEEGEEISFEGCVLPAESSIDGKEHEIHSFEEYEQWKKYEDQ